MADECEDLRKAADLVREEHKPGDPLWEFWNSVAAWFGHEAEGAQFGGTIKTPQGWANFNRSVRAARTLLDSGWTVGPPVKNEPHGEG